MNVQIACGVGWRVQGQLAGVYIPLKLPFRKLGHVPIAAGTNFGHTSPRNTKLTDEAPYLSSKSKPSSKTSGLPPRDFTREDFHSLLKRAINSPAQKPASKANKHRLVRVAPIVLEGAFVQIRLKAFRGNR